MAVTLAHDKDEHTLNNIWRAIYWSTFALAWILLPIQMQYHMSGEFSFGRKLWEAVKANLISYLAGFVMLFIFIIYLVATKGSTKTFHFLAFMMAMGNTYGVILIILLMGNGLVALPRRLWRMGNSKTELTRLYVMAITVESAFHDARFELEDCEAQAKLTYESFDLPTSDRSLKPLIETIKTMVDSFEFAFRSNSNKFRSVKASEKKPITEKAPLVALHARVKTAQLRVKSSERRWRNLLIQVKFLQSLLDGSLRPEESGWCGLRTDASPRVQGSSSFCSILKYQFLTSYDSLRLFFRKYLFSFTCRILSLLCALASGLIFYCELGMSSNVQSPIGDTIVGLSNTGAGVFIVQTISFGYLFYMSLCTFWSLFKINLGWSFTLQGPHQSPASSLLFNATYLSRLQFSLGYNFLLFLNSPRIDGTSFQFLMADMEIVPLFGSSFSVYAPIITAIIGAFTFLNIYARILKFIGIQDEDSVTVAGWCGKLSDSEKEEIESGKKLVNGALRTLNNILIAESRAAHRDTISLLPTHGIAKNNGASDTDGLGGDDDGDMEMINDDEETSPKRDDMTAWGRDSPSSSSFYSSFKSENKEEVKEPPKEKSLFGSWKTKETKTTLKESQPTQVSASTRPVSNVASPPVADQKKTEISSPKDSNSSNKRPTVEKETKGNASSSTSIKSTPPPPPPSNDAWGSTGGGWDVPTTTTRRGGRYG